MLQTVAEPPYDGSKRRATMGCTTNSRLAPTNAVSVNSPGSSSCPGAFVRVACSIARSDDVVVLSIACMTPSPRAAG